jgi:hypothetical protein
MATSPSATPTPITPPRVPLIDARTGLIDRAWYLFLLSLFQTAQNAEGTQLGPNAESLIASYDEALRAAQQTAETQSLAPQFNEFVKQIQALECLPPPQFDELDKRIQALECLPPPREFKLSRYGSFYSTATQTATTINTAKEITLNTTDLSSGVFLSGSPQSRINVDTDGIYNLQLSIQLDKTAGGTAEFYIWFRKNGVDVTDSASQIRIQGNNAEIFSALNYFFSLKAGDYVEIMFSVSDLSVELLAVPATAPHPGIPSIIVTVSNNIQGFQ